MAQVPKADPLPYSRTFQVDTYAVVKVHFWPNQQHGMHAAIITSHGCWIADLASNPGANPSECPFSQRLHWFLPPVYMHQQFIFTKISQSMSQCALV